MSAPQPAAAVLDRHFLELRCSLLDLAAAFDRVERSPEFSAVQNDPRLALLQDGLRILLDSGTDRAERIQLLFSEQYEPNWKS